MRGTIIHARREDRDELICYLSRGRAHTRRNIIVYYILYTETDVWKFCAAAVTSWGDLLNVSNYVFSSPAPSRRVDDGRDEMRPYPPRGARKTFVRRTR